MLHAEHYPFGRGNFHTMSSNESFVRAKHLQVINHIHVLHDAHFLSGSRFTSLIVIKEVIRQREGLVFIQGQITSICHPVAMDSLVVNEQAERLLVITLVFHPVDGIIGNDVGYVTVLLNGIILLRNEIRIIVIPLSRHNLPVIKP